MSDALTTHQRVLLEHIEANGGRVEVWYRRNGAGKLVRSHATIPPAPTITVTIGRVLALRDKGKLVRIPLTESEASETPTLKCWTYRVAGANT